MIGHHLLTKTLLLKAFLPFIFACVRKVLEADFHKLKILTKWIVKPPKSDDFGGNSGCGGRTRTYDLRVMSPTSFQLLYSAILAALLECLDSIAWQSSFVKGFYLSFFCFPERFLLLQLVGFSGWHILRFLIRLPLRLWGKYSRRKSSIGTAEPTPAPTQPVLHRWFSSALVEST